MRRVTLKGANFLKMLLVTTATMLAICLLALVETTNTAEATSLSQNGKIAFTSIRSGNYAIYTAEPDDSNLRQLSDGTYPSWSPDGTKLAFDTSGDISVMNAEGSNLRNLNKNGGAYGFNATWSPDGTKLAFDSGGDIYMIDPDGSNKINLTNTPGHYETLPDFSPSGSQMCIFRLNNTGNPKPATGIYVMDADGSDRTLLLEVDFMGGVEGGCDWSPDGTKIAFHARLDSLEGIERSDLKGGGLEKVTATLDAEVYVIDADGDGRMNLTSNSRVEDVAPAWSPDGTKITFMSNREGNFDIYTMNADGSDVVQVTNSRYDDLDPDWQPLPMSRSETVQPPDTGGPSLLLAASALLIFMGVLLYAVVKRRM